MMLHSDDVNGFYWDYFIINGSETDLVTMEMKNVPLKYTKRTFTRYKPIKTALQHLLDEEWKNNG